jgi:hypothetical protein
MVEQVAAFLDEDVDKLRIQPVHVEGFVRVLGGGRGRQQCRKRSLFASLGRGRDFGGTTLGFDTRGFGPGFGKTRRFQAIRFLAGRDDALGFLAVGFGTRSFHARRFGPLGGDAFVLKALRFDACGLFRGQALGFGLRRFFRSDSFRFRLLGGEARRFGFLCRDAFRFHALGFEACGFFRRKAFRFRQFGREAGFLCLSRGDAFRFQSFFFDTRSFQRGQAFGFQALGFEARRFLRR